MVRNNPLYLRLLGLFLASCLLTGCFTVNFNWTGTLTNTDSNLETLFVDQFTNEAPIVVPYLAQEVTNQLQERFLNQSRLTLTDGAADIELSGSVVRYNVAPVAITGSTEASQNRLTIAIRINFLNNQDEDDSWEQTFTKFVDFDAREDFASIEEDKINEILEQVTQDVFTKSLGKW
ncbi:MAG: LptE family protein [Bacteroidota bacterium]